MLRDIIKIDEDLCDGCGNCVTGCSEGALQIVNGKAKLVKEQFCDGFGDCIGTCPTGALTVEKREAEEFDEEATMHFLQEEHGDEAVRKFEAAQKRHEQKEAEPPFPIFSGCPGSQARILKKKQAAKTDINAAVTQAIQSDLEQWPVQLHLVPPKAPYFKNKELVILSTCSPVASADVHWRYIRGRGVVVACPKLDDTRNYAYKLAEIFKETSIPKVIIVRMAVPCCRGLLMIAQEAVKLSGRTDLIVEEHVISLDGKVQDIIRVQ